MFTHCTIKGKCVKYCKEYFWGTFTMIYYMYVHIYIYIYIYIPYILESKPHPFYSFRELKNPMRIRIACGLDSRSRAGFWKNDRAAVRAVRTI